MSEGNRNVEFEIQMTVPVTTRHLYKLPPGYSITRVIHDNIHTSKPMARSTFCQKYCFTVIGACEPIRRERNRKTGGKMDAKSPFYVPLRDTSSLHGDVGINKVRYTAGV